MSDNIEKFVPKNPVEVEKRFSEIAKRELSELDDLMTQAGLGPSEQSYQFKSVEDLTSAELLTKWDELIDALGIPDNLIDDEKDEHEEIYRLVLEVNEDMVRECLQKNFKFISGLSTQDERIDYVLDNKNLLLYVRRLKALVKNNQ